MWAAKKHCIEMWHVSINTASSLRVLSREEVASVLRGGWPIVPERNELMRASHKSAYFTPRV